MTRNPDCCSHLDWAPFPHLLSSPSGLPGPLASSASQACCASVADPWAGAATWPVPRGRPVAWPTRDFRVAWALLVLVLGLLGGPLARSRAAGRSRPAGRADEVRFGSLQEGDFFGAGGQR